MIFNKRHFVTFCSIFFLFLISACSKESLDPEITFKVNETTIHCKRPENISAYLNRSNNKLSINGSNYHQTSPSYHEIKFILNHVDLVKNMVGLNIPLQSSISSENTNPTINGYVYINTHSSNFEFTDIQFKITHFKNNRISGVFSGIIQSTIDPTSKEILEGQFTDILIEDMVI